MEKTAQIKLLPTKEQEKHLLDISKEYIKTVNTLVSKIVQAKKSIKSIIKRCPSTDAKCCQKSSNP
ncbi:hypothetical protein ACONDI_02027 [Natranaerofaba carboxydovora]|nr:hypothetical protein [Natranaerofaba carboxydovora]UMZ74436.1 hypothetical protein ACONDI_02027 [Natranaerofaba carboxydovora]